MSDYPSQPELDDELLSAYLDGELSAEDTAAVEARLAADPAAAELLQQLRAMSQAVQGLPQEVVGHDLSEVVLRRVEDSRRTTSTTLPAGSIPVTLHAGSSNGSASPTSQSMPTFTIGRTRRGWAWAALAVAAALLIMVIQSSPDRDQILPNVAQRDEPAAEAKREGQVAQGQLDIRALREPAAPAAADVALHDGIQPSPTGTEALDTWSFRGRVPADEPQAPSDGVAATGRARQFATEPANEPAMAPPTRFAAPTVTLNIEPQTDNISQPSDQIDLDAASPAAPTGAVADQEANGTATDAPVDRLATAPPAAGLSGESQEAATTEMSAFGTLPQPAGEEQLVVVHVLAKRAALENKAFEKLLVTNGIQVTAEETQVAEGARANVQLSREFADEREVRRTLEPTAQQTQNAAEEDVLLVEAPSAAIVSCLESLNRDEENFLGIEVDESSQRELLRETPAEPANDFAATDLAARHGESPVATKPKELAEERGLAKYNRGIIPTKRELSDRDKALFYRYYDSSAQNDRYGGTGGYGGGYGAYGVRGGLEQAQQQLADSSGEKAPQSATKLGRAVRLRSRNIGLPQLRAQQVDEALARGETRRADSQPDGRIEKLTELYTESKSAAGPLPDTLHVLFVLRPGEEPAPSRPVRNKAQ